MISAGCWQEWWLAIYMCVSMMSQRNSGCQRVYHDWLGLGSCATVTLTGDSRQFITRALFVIVAACPPNNEQKFYHETTKIFGGVSGRAFKNSSTGTDASILLYRSDKNRFSYRSRIFGLKKVVQFESCVTTYQLDRRHAICLGLAHHVALERRQFNLTVMTISILSKTKELVVAEGLW